MRDLHLNYRNIKKNFFGCDGLCKQPSKFGGTPKAVQIMSVRHFERDRLFVLMSVLVDHTRNSYSVYLQETSFVKVIYYGSCNSMLKQYNQSLYLNLQNHGQSGSPITLNVIYL